MNGKSRKAIVLLLSVFYLAGVRAGETWYLISNESSAGNAWKTPASWSSDGTASGTKCSTMSASDVYVVKDGKRLRNGTISFAGGTLQLGDGTTAGDLCLDGGDKSIPRLELKKGTFLMNYGGKSHTVSGSVAVSAPDSAPYLFSWNPEGQSNGTLVVSGAVSGASGTGLAFQQESTRNSTFVFSDVAGYKGSFEMKTATRPYLWKNDYSSGTYGVRLVLNSVDTPGSISVNSAGSISAYANTTVIRAKSVTLHRGCRLWVETTGSIRATDTLTVETKNSTYGPVEVFVNAPIAGTPGADMRIPILTGPLDSDFTKGHFILTQTAACPNGDLDLDVEVDDSAGTKTLYLTGRSCVTQVKGVTRENEAGRTFNNILGIPGSSITNAASWSDGVVPHTFADYRTAMGLRTVWNPADHAEYTFPGDSLTLDGASAIFTLMHDRVNVKRLVAQNGATVAGGEEIDPRLVAESFAFGPGLCILRQYRDKQLVLDGEIVGTGDVLMKGRSFTSIPGASYRLTGLNTNFIGRVRISQEYVDGNNQVLYLEDGRNLGGKLQSFDPQAFVVESNAMVRVDGEGRTVVLADGLNRGLTVVGHAWLDIPKASSSLLIAWPVALAGELHKTGSGALTLAKPLTVSDACTVDVLDGTLRVADADAVNGSTVVVGEGAALQIVADPSNVKLVSEGLRNLAEMPFVWASATETLPLSVDWSACGLAETSDFIQGVLTVKADVAPTIRGRLPRLASPGRRLRASWVEISDETAGTVTFAAAVRSTGMVLLFR